MAGSEDKELRLISIELKLVKQPSIAGHLECTSHLMIWTLTHLQG